VVPDTDLQERPTAPTDSPTDVDVPPIPLRSANGRANALVVTGIVAGLALAGLSAAGVGGLEGGLRWVLPVVGVGIAFAAAGVAGRRRYGPRYQPGLYLAITWLALAALSAVFADLLPLSEAKDSSKTLTAPILASPNLFSSHPLGTDRQGLDILGGIIYGFRVSLIVGVGAVLIGVVIGGAIGLVAGYYRRRVDAVVGIFTDATLAFPPLILLIALATSLRPSTVTIMISLGVVTVPVYVRLARAHAMTVSQRKFVLAARAQGARNLRILVREVAPLVSRPLLAYGFVMVAVMIVAEASLSFLGLSIPPPYPTLGNMISAGQPDFRTYPYLVFAPATALFLTVLSLNQLGEEAQRRLNHRESKL
jgi:peptide/nickel transport system permease protein